MPCDRHPAHPPRSRHGAPTPSRPRPRSRLHAAAARPAAVAASVLTAAALAAPAAADEGIPDQVVIELDDEATIDDVVLPPGVLVLAGLPEPGLYLLQFPGPISDEEIDDFEDDDPAVDEAERNRRQDLAGGQTQGVFYDSIEGDFRRQWGFERVRPAGAWRTTTGAGVVVAVLDTGVDATHPQLAGAIAPGGIDLVDGDEDPSDAGDGIDADGDGLVDELVGHGTMIAGVVRHIAPDATILPIRILDGDGLGTSFRIAAGVYHAVEQGADVINLSLGSTEPQEALLDAVQAARAAGVVVVAAVGNLGAELPIIWPAGDDAALGVAALDPTDARAGFSSFGPQVFISAPGVDVEGPVPGALYRGSEGTSFAAAFVSGAAALARAGFPALTRDELVAAIALGAAPIDAANPGLEGALGAGRVDLAGIFGVEVLADVDGDGQVALGDVLAVLATFGDCAGCPADLDGSWSVDFDDLVAVLGSWGG